MALNFDTTPALVPPAGVVPNLQNPENIHPLIGFTLGICLGVSSVFVILRIWARFLILKTPSWDDYTMVVAWLCYIAYTVIGWEAMRFGSGIHQWNVSLSDMFVFLKLANVMEVFYNPLIFMTKLSILLQYQRLFCPHRAGWTFRAIWFLIIFNFLFYVAVMIPQIVVCNPREKIWHPYLEGKCLDLPTILISGAVVNIISDFSILILPLVKVSKLQLSLAKKLGVSSVFATGLFGCISSILRLVNNVQFKNTQDVTWDLTPVALWTVAEISSGIICGSVPSVPILFKHAGPKLKSSFASWTSKKTTDHEGSAGSGKSGYKESSYIELGDKGRSDSQVALAKP